MVKSNTSPLEGQTLEGELEHCDSGSCGEKGGREEIWRGLESLIPVDAAGLRAAASLKETEMQRGIKNQIFPMRCKVSESLQNSCTAAAPESAVRREYALVRPCLPEPGGTSRPCSKGWANLQAFPTRCKAN